MVGEIWEVIVQFKQGDRSCHSIINVIISELLNAEELREKRSSSRLIRNSIEVLLRFAEDSFQIIGKINHYLPII
jgi:hypothetical protein